AAQRQGGLLGPGERGENFPLRPDSLGSTRPVPPTPSERPAQGSTPAGTRALETHYESLRYEVLVESPHAWTTEWATLASPERRAGTADGPRPTAVSERTAALFASTSARRLGMWVSLLSTFALAATAVVLPKKLGSPKKPGSPTGRRPRRR
ncbi:MAG: hypothetical protein AAGF23_12665, partial [Acidobacteriota bacterium]